MQIIGLARLGRDADLRYTADQTPVANLSLAFNYGKKDGNGHRPSQWIEASLWGKVAEALIDFLVKGQAVSVTLDDPHIEEYQKRDGGIGSKLVARVLTIELAGRSESGGQQDRQPPSKPGRQYSPQPGPGKAPPTDLDDDIPF